jgi:AcrR family transcriptional regulator
MKVLAHETILDAAEQVFAERGFESPMEAIAERAGVAVGTLYNHFDSREELIEAHLGERRDQLFAQMREASERASALPFRERLLAILGTMMTAMEGQTAFRRMLFQADLPRKRSKREAVARELNGLFEDVFAQGHREGALAPDPDRLQTVFLVAMVHGAIGISLHAPDRLPLARIPELLVQQFLDGAGARGKKK